MRSFFSLKRTDRLKEPLQQKDRPENVTILQGDSTTFKCTFKTQVPVRIVWIRGLLSETNAEELKLDFMVSGCDFVQVPKLFLNLSLFRVYNVVVPLIFFPIEFEKLFILNTNCLIYLLTK